MPLPIDLNPDVAVGISLPIQGGNGGYFNQTYTTREQVVSNLLNLLLTIPGERLMQPDFGSKLHQYIFEQFTDGVAEALKSSIENAIKIWLPYVGIEEIIVTDGVESPGDEYNENNYHTIIVRLVVFLNVDPETHMEITLRGEGETGKVIIDSIGPNGTGSPESDSSDKQVYNSLKGL